MAYCTSWLQPHPIGEMVRRERLASRSIYRRIAGLMVHKRPPRLSILRHQRRSHLLGMPASKPPAVFSFPLTASLHCHTSVGCPSGKEAWKKASDRDISGRDQGERQGSGCVIDGERRQERGMRLSNPFTGSDGRAGDVTVTGYLGRETGPLPPICVERKRIGRGKMLFPSLERQLLCFCA